MRERWLATPSAFVRFLSITICAACGALEPKEEPGEAPADNIDGSDADPSAARPTGASPKAAGGVELLRPAQGLRWPLEQVYITSRFGWRTDPVSGAGLRLHRGVDLRGASGDLVLAAGVGRVSFSGWDPALGELVIIDHGDGLETWYAHLSSRLVHEGLRLRTGSAIGNVGNTGRSAAPHLHLSVKLDGEAVDPLPFFRAR